MSSRQVKQQPPSPDATPTGAEAGRLCVCAGAVAGCLTGLQAALPFSRITGVVIVVRRARSESFHLGVLPTSLPQELKVPKSKGSILQRKHNSSCCSDLNILWFFRDVVFVGCDGR